MREREGERDRERESGRERERAREVTRGRVGERETEGEREREREGGRAGERGRERGRPGEGGRERARSAESGREELMETRRPWKTQQPTTLNREHNRILTLGQIRKWRRPENEKDAHVARRNQRLKRVSTFTSSDFGYPCF